MKSRLCVECGEEKPLDSFKLQRPNSQARQFVCIDCQGKAPVPKPNMSKLSRLRNSELALADAQAGAKAIKKSRRKKASRVNAREHLGLTAEQLRTFRERIQEAQGNCCAICGAPFSPLNPASLDHCHQSRTIRGVLCARCNTGLGMFGDDPEVLQRAAAYVIRHRERGLQKSS